jgi:hypothetical protein
MDIDEHVKELQQSDQRTLARRAERRLELSQISTDGRLFASQREWDYAEEASESYIVGNYRSTIFCCACAVEQIIKYEYLKIPENKYGEIGKCTLGQTIYRCTKKRIPSLTDFLEKAGLLNDIRNQVAAHPLFIDLPVTTDTDQRARKELLLKDIIALLDLVAKLDPSLRQEIESTLLMSEVEGKNYSLDLIIRGEEEVPFNLNGFWGLIEKDVLKFLANRSWTILKDIAEGLYGVSS